MKFEAARIYFVSDVFATVAFVVASAPHSHFENEAKCKIFLLKISFICMRNKKSFSYQWLCTYPRFETGFGAALKLPFLLNKE